LADFGEPEPRPANGRQRCCHLPTTMCPRTSHHAAAVKRA
jgi:hypothetical protein